MIYFRVVFETKDFLLVIDVSSTFTVTIITGVCWNDLQIFVTLSPLSMSPSLDTEHLQHTFWQE
jgi:hypothetical protein